jgi:YcxB-like protein
VPSPTVRTKPFSIDRDAYVSIHTKVYRAQLVLKAAPFVVLAYLILVVFFRFAWWGLLPLLAIVFIIGIYAQPKVLRWVISDKKYDSFFQDRTVSFTETHYLYRGLNGRELMVPLDSVASVRKLDDYYVLAISKSQSLFIPENAFADHPDRQLFQTYIKAQVAKTVGF